jgi:hypothetical protein
MSAPPLWTFLAPMTGHVPDLSFHALCLSINFQHLLDSVISPHIHIPLEHESLWLGPVIFHFCVTKPVQFALNNFFSLKRWLQKVTKNIETTACVGDLPRAGPQGSVCVCS